MNGTGNAQAVQWSADPVLLAVAVPPCILLSLAQRLSGVSCVRMLHPVLGVCSHLRNIFVLDYQIAVLEHIFALASVTSQVCE